MHSITNRITLLPPPPAPAAPARTLWCDGCGAEVAESTATAYRRNGANYLVCETCETPVACSRCQAVVPSGCTRNGICHWCSDYPGFYADHTHPENVCGFYNRSQRRYVLLTVLPALGIVEKVA